MMVEIVLIAMSLIINYLILISMIQSNKIALKQADLIRERHRTPLKWTLK